MTIQECYELAGADYGYLMKRFGSEQLLRKYLVKFRQDTSYARLQSAMEAQNAEEAFAAVHMLKGISLNMNFTRLYRISADLTEMLRGGEMPEDMDKYTELQDEYNRISDILNKIE